MDIVDVLEQQLPFLRRYARAVTGDILSGDAHVESLLLSVLENGPDNTLRRALYTDLDRSLLDASDQVASSSKTKDAVSRMHADTRRALLLTAMEEFSVAETGLIMSRTSSDIEDLLFEAERELKTLLKSRLMIIEDEPMIAASLKQIARSLGHNVVGHAATRATAVKLAAETKPDLILADVMLADGSLGTDAVADIHKERAVPVIFITAYPEKLLTGKGAEPAYLIPKPFKTAMVKAVISQAIFVAAYTKK